MNTEQLTAKIEETARANVDKRGHVFMNQLALDLEAFGVAGLLKDIREKPYIRGQIEEVEAVLETVIRGSHEWPINMYEREERRLLNKMLGEKP